MSGLFLTDQLRRIFMEAAVPYISGHVQVWSQQKLPMSTVEKQSNFGAYDLECRIDDYGELVVQVGRLGLEDSKVR